LWRVAAFLLFLLVVGSGGCAGTFWLLSQLGATGQVSIPLLLAILAAGGALALLLMAGVRSMALPLGDLIDAAGRAEAGDFSARVAPRGPRELRALSRALNAMLERLEQSAAHRRDLLADVTHELRTPVTIVQGNLEGILDGVYPADEPHLRPALEEIRQLSHLIDDLRTLSLAESGALQLHREPTDLAELAEDVASSFRSLAEARGIQLVVEAADGLPLVEIDPVRIREVMVNLTANALRHTPQGGGVTIAASFDGKKRLAQIAVRDRGEGIAPGDLPLIFDRFYKSEGSEGTGLGLTIAKNLVAAHGGEISAESALGKGTTIRFTLPSRPPTS
jgi:two-component system OmpR family sensor kinase/two-component system sensor histidine kinase BaeS